MILESYLRKESPFPSIYRKLITVDRTTKHLPGTVPLAAKYMISFLQRTFLTSKDPPPFLLQPFHPFSSNVPPNDVPVEACPGGVPPGSQLYPGQH